MELFKTKVSKPELGRGNSKSKARIKVKCREEKKMVQCYCIIKYFPERRWRQGWKNRLRSSFKVSRNS